MPNARSQKVVVPNICGCMGLVLVGCRDVSFYFSS